MLSRMETIVWWSPRGGWRPLYGGARGGGNLNQEVTWKPLYCGVEGDESLIEEVKRRLFYGGAHGGDGN